MRVHPCKHKARPHTTGQIERERKRGRERVGESTRTLSDPHSVSQSACVIIILIINASSSTGGEHVDSKWDEVVERIRSCWLDSCCGPAIVSGAGVKLSPLQSMFENYHGQG